MHVDMFMPDAGMSSIKLNTYDIRALKVVREATRMGEAISAK